MRRRKTQYRRYPPVCFGKVPSHINSKRDVIPSSLTPHFGERHSAPQTHPKMTPTDRRPHTPAFQICQRMIPAASPGKALSRWGMTKRSARNVWQTPTVLLPDLPLVRHHHQLRERSAPRASHQHSQKNSVFKSDGSERTVTPQWLLRFTCF